MLFMERRFISGLGDEDPSTLPAGIPSGNNGDGYYMSTIWKEKELNEREGKGRTGKEVIREGRERKGKKERLGREGKGWEGRRM